MYCWKSFVNKLICNGLLLRFNGYVLGVNYDLRQQAIKVKANESQLILFALCRLNDLFIFIYSFPKYLYHLWLSLDIFRVAITSYEFSTVI